MATPEKPSTNREKLLPQTVRTWRKADGGWELIVGSSLVALSGAVSVAISGSVIETGRVLISTCGGGFTVGPVTGPVIMARCCVMACPSVALKDDPSKDSSSKAD